MLCWFLKKTHNCLERHECTDHDIILNLRRSASGIIYTFLGVASLWKLQIQPAIASDSTYGEIVYIYKAINKTKAIRIYTEALALHTSALTVHW